jgi:transcriptional regulator with XRE-family HTH domain
MNATAEALREEFKDSEYSESYAESFLDSYLATQIKVLREQNGWTQEILADRIGTKQGAISRIEDVNYSKWNVSTLKKLGRAFRVRVKVSFETYGSLIGEVQTFSRENLQRTPREKDPVLFPEHLPRIFIASNNKKPNGRRMKIVAHKVPHHGSVQTTALYLPPTKNQLRGIGVAENSAAQRAAS